MTNVANVLVTMAIVPFVTALMARFALGHRLPARTWAAVFVAGAGIAWMYANEVAAADPRHLAGIAVALGVPIAGAINWTVIQRAGKGGGDLLPAVLIGAIGSCLATLLPSLPFAATGTDLALLGLLGVAQLAIPCLIAVAAARHLSAPEAALLSLLEIVFGVTWTWLFGGETPGRHVLTGGLLVIGALVANEALALRRRT
jgi:drug/metabolite transporter (DMT)-like permease